MQNKYKKSREKRGFSLIELSIVILIVSILITGSLGISKTAINNSKTKVTKDRMDAVYQAFTNFLATNRRLPCPALLTVAKGTAGYGAETTPVVTCTNTFVSSTNAPNLVYGMVPITALGLDPDMAEDGWGTKFTYVVDKRFTKQSVGLAASDGFEITKGIPSDVDISSTDLSGIDAEGPLTSLLLSNRNGVFLLLSHGANKFNGFNATGTAQNGTSTVTDENDNSCNTCSNSGTTSFNRIFLTSSTDPNFDDIALFKTKTQLVRDARLESIMCSLNEATTTGPITWTLNGSYRCSVCANTANNSKYCGPYGVWSANSTTTCTVNTTTCSSANSFNPDMVIYAHQTANAVDGGTLTAAAWQTRVLNTTLYSKDSVGGTFSLAANTITLAAGTYLVEATSAAHSVGRNQIRFRNTSDNTTAIVGASVYADVGSNTDSYTTITGTVTIASSKNFQLQQYSESTGTTNGFGVKNLAGMAEVNIFATVKITKLI